MRIFLILCIYLMSGCGYTTDANPADEAKPYIGLQEQQDRQELKAFLGIDPVRTEWCAAFVNAVLELNETPSLNTLNHPHPLLARSFLDWGSSINPQDIEYGDLVIFPRGGISWQGHVGFYIGRYPHTGEWIILGGNQNNKVTYSLFKPSKAIGIRRFPT